MKLHQSTMHKPFDYHDCTILIIDDEPANLKLMVDTLDNCGFKTAVALTGQKGFELAQSEQPDLILLDLNLPDVQGYDICQQLKEDFDTQDIPVIFLTVSSGTQDRIKGFEVGAVDYIAKPFNHKEVVARISTHLKIKVLTEHLEQTVLNRTTELLHTNQRLKKSEERYALAQRFGNIGSWDWDINNDYLSWSETIEPMFGFSKGEFKENYEAFLDCVHPADRRMVQEAVSASLEKQIEYTMEHRIVWPDGTIKWVAETGNVFRDEQGEPLRMVGIVQDITLRKTTEEELQKYQQYLEELVQERTTAILEAKEQAEAANRAKSEFLARMSHEIRTPLNVVMGLTGLTLKSELHNEQRNNLNKVQLACNNLLTVINDILDFSKVEAGKLDLVMEDFDLNQIMEQLVDMFGTRTEQKDLELILSVEPQIPRQLQGDSGRLLQILTNLIENAIKFTDHGEIVIGVQLDENTEVEPDQIALQFRVQDTGIGIDTKLLPTLFEPFTQADSTLTRSRKGSGLGLSICHRFVKLMGGDIRAESTPGNGTTLYFTTLLQKTEEGKSQFATPEDLLGLKTLVVDDSPASRQVLSEQLRSFGFNVTAAESGKQALNFLKLAAETTPYQLVLMDWKMPELDGLETTRIIHDMPGLKELPVIILVTAFGQEFVEKSIETSPADNVLLKPVMPSLLFGTIMELYDKAEFSMESGINQHHVDQPDQLKGKRVLVVEDSPMNRDVAVALLEWKDMKVEVAENGLIAVEMVTNAPHNYYNAVLMDIQMPVMDGYTASKKIRNSQSINRDIPIIAFTAHALAGEREKCLAAGLDDYVAKPIDEKHLENVLRRWTSIEDQEKPASAIMTIKNSGSTTDNLDVESALRRLGGKKEIYLLVLEKFALENEKTYENMHLHLKSNNKKGVLEITHTLKGTADTIGATALGNIARSLERAIHSDSVELNELLVDLKKELDNTLENIASLLLTGDF